MTSQAKSLIVIEDVNAAGTQWLLSFDGPNPTDDQCVHCVDRAEAFKAKALVENALTELRDADAALVALGIADDGRTLAERIKALAEQAARDLAEMTATARRFAFTQEQPLICRTCGGIAEEDRRCYARPTCHACLPPPPPIDRIQREPTPLAPGIDSHPGRLGGAPCISGTRITVAALQALSREGLPAEEIHALYPALTREQVEAALAYEMPEEDDCDHTRFRPSFIDGAERCTDCGNVLTPDDMRRIEQVHGVR